MATLTRTLTFFFLAFILVTACSKDEDPVTQPEMMEEEMEDPCKDVDASYKDDVSAILAASCAISGCHVSGFNKGDFSVYDNVKDNATKIKSRAVDQKNMPPANSDAPKLTDVQLELLGCWIASGAEDN